MRDHQIALHAVGILPTGAAGSNCMTCVRETAPADRDILRCTTDDDSIAGISRVRRIRRNDVLDVVYIATGNRRVADRLEMDDSEERVMDLQPLELQILEKAEM